MAKQPVCPHFMRGRCKFGIRCRLAHPTAAPQPFETSHFVKTRLCHNFTAKGKCMFGDQCHFVHDRHDLRPTAKAAAAAGPAVRQMVPRPHGERPTATVPEPHPPIAVAAQVVQAVAGTQVKITSSAPAAAIAAETLVCDQSVEYYCFFNQLPLVKWTAQKKKGEKEDQRTFGYAIGDDHSFSMLRSDMRLASVTVPILPIAVAAPVVASTKVKTSAPTAATAAGANARRSAPVAAAASASAAVSRDHGGTSRHVFHQPFLRNEVPFIGTHTPSPGDMCGASFCKCSSSCPLLAHPRHVPSCMPKSSGDLDPRQHATVGCRYGVSSLGVT
jgi:hypothetical protein